jgi:hypothetical protein
LISQGPARSPLLATPQLGGRTEGCLVNANVKDEGLRTWLIHDDSSRSALDAATNCDAPTCEVDTDADWFGVEFNRNWVLMKDYFEAYTDDDGNEEPAGAKYKLYADKAKTPTERLQADLETQCKDVKALNTGDACKAVKARVALNSYVQGWDNEKKEAKQWYPDEVVFPCVYSAPKVAAATAVLATKPRAFCEQGTPLLKEMTEAKKVDKQTGQFLTVSHRR